MRTIYTLCLAVACSGISLVSDAQNVNWPFHDQHQQHKIWHAYGQYLHIETDRYFHQGVDILADENTVVKCGRQGRIVEVNDAAVEYFQKILVGIDLTATPARAYKYLHMKVAKHPVMTMRNWRAGDAINPADIANHGDILGKIVKVPGLLAHLHFEYDNKENPLSWDPKGAFLADIDSNAIERLVPHDDTIKPTIFTPFYYRPQSGELLPDPAYFKNKTAAKDTVVKGNLDMVARVYDRFNAFPGTNYDLNILKIEFKVKADVGMAAIAYQESEYFSAKFLKAGAPNPGRNTYAKHSDRVRTNTIYENDNTCKSKSLLGDGTSEFYYILTNIDEDYDLERSDTARYWDTNGKAGEPWNDNREDAAHEATKNAEAEFPDGRYVITVKTTGQGGVLDTISATQRIFVNNFNEKIETGNWATGKVTNLFGTGDNVFIKGEGFPKNRTFKAYVVKNKKWADGDTIINPETTTNVTSNNDGVIPPTIVWNNYAKNGKPDKGYDLVLDYDDDKKYTTPKEGFTVDAIHDDKILGAGFINPNDYLLSIIRLIFGFPTGSPTCMGAQLLDLGAHSTLGNNYNAGAGTAPACWLSPADNDVWYKFTVTTSGWYTVSCDNGVNAVGNDTQLGLYNACGGTPIACSEDLSKPENSNNLAALLTAELDSGTYYVQVDLYGADTGNFCINVFENAVPENDCITDAIDITGLIDDLDTSHIAGGAYFYNTPDNGTLPFNDEPTWDNLASTGRPALTGNCSGPLADSTYGVWFSFVYDADIPCFMSVYPNNGGNFYVMELYKSNGASLQGCSGTAVSGVDFIDCSAGDGGVPGSAGGERNKAAGSMSDHPRLDLRALDDISDGDTLYLLVHQYTRNAMGSPGDVAASPSDGIFNLVVEIAPDQCRSASVSGGDNDCCSTELFDSSCTDIPTQYNLSNAGMQGGISALEGGYALPAGRPDEPSRFSALPGNTNYDLGCTGNADNIASVLSTTNNNSIYYKFSICSYADTIDISGVDTIFGVAMNSITISDTSLITPELFAGILACERITFSEKDGYLPTGPVPPLEVNFPLPDSCCILSVCEASIKLCFDNIRYAGVNGKTAEFYIIPVDTNCLDGFSPGAAISGVIPFSIADSCFCMEPAANLAPGEYHLVVDGDGGSLVNFDLAVEMSYFIKGTDIPCQSCNTEASMLRYHSIRKDLASTGIKDPRNGLQPKYLYPAPASDYVDLVYTSAVTGTVTYTIVDIAGKEVKRGFFAVSKGSNTHRFSTESLSDGLYTISLQTDGMESKLKLLIAK